jgi:RNA helicase HrpA
MSDLAPGLAAAPSPSDFRFAYPELPVSERRDEVMAALAKHRVVIVEGGTGSGKSTQLPKIMLEAGLLRQGLLGVTQPRRIAALALTDRLREETGAKQLIGSQIRFHEDMPEGARVKVMTDGVLLQEYRRDPYLRRYDALVLDEAHERSLNIDILLGVGLMLCRKRADFKLVVASATLDAERFQRYFADTPGGAGLLRVEGRQYPVRIEYRDPGNGEEEEPEEDAPPNPRALAGQAGRKRVSDTLSPVEAAAAAIRELIQSKPDDLLCFLPTEKEIHELARELEKDLADRCVILPLYGRLAPGDQKRVYQRHHRPKVVLATNIAETSLTLPGIAYVVDTGTARISRYHPQTRIQGLPIEKIAQASAAQRAGRAGRVKPGLCIRLYGEDDLKSRPEWPEPEILRGNLTNAVLQLLSLRLPVLDFPFLDPPAPAALKGAYRRLQELGAVVDEGETMQLTDEGWRMSRLPVDAALAKILLTAQTYRTLPSAMVVAAGLTVQDVRITPNEEPERGKAVGLHRRFDDPQSDFLALLKLWAFLQREWRDGFSQRRLRRLCEDNYLSYMRVREWMDLVEQFSRLLAPRPGKRGEVADMSLPSANDLGSPYDIDLAKLDTDALHKALLSGFLAHLARRRRDEPGYRLVGDKEAFIHAGSGLAKRRPEWIVAGEVRQTSRTFIQRACEIQPTWVEEVAPDAVKRSYGDIAWNPERGFVEAVERVSYRNFTLRQDRRIDYARVDAAACAALFWQEAVIHNQNAGPFAFMAHNQAVLATLAGHEAKVRRRDLSPGDDTLLAWYLDRAPEVHSRVTLQRFLEKSTPSLPTPHSALHLKPEDFEPVEACAEWQKWRAWTKVPGLKPPAHVLESLFPDHINAGSAKVRLAYRFDFGQELDGLSIEAPLQTLPDLNPNQLWLAVPGWRLWIFQAALEKLATKEAERIQAKAEEIFDAWQKRMEPGTLTPAQAYADAVAAVLPDMPQAIPSWPAVWPHHLRLKLFFTAANGRRLLLAIDPGMGMAEWALSAAEQLYGKTYASRPYADVLAEARQAWADAPPSLKAHGLRLAPLPPANPGTSPGTSHTGYPEKPSFTAYAWRRDGVEAEWDEAMAAAQPPLSHADLKLALERWDRQGRVGDFLMRRFEALAAALRIPHPVFAACKPWLDALCGSTMPHILAHRGMPETLLPELEKHWRPAKITFKQASAKSFKDLQPVTSAPGNASALAAWWLVLGAASLVPLTQDASPTPEACSDFDLLWRAIAECEAQLIPGSAKAVDPIWRMACDALAMALRNVSPIEVASSRAALAAAATLALNLPHQALPIASFPADWEAWHHTFPFSSLQDRQRKKAKQEADTLRQELKTLGLLPQHWPKGSTEKLDAFAAGGGDASILLHLQVFAAREALKRAVKKAFPASTANESIRNAGALQSLQGRFKKL